MATLVVLAAQQAHAPVATACLQLRSTACQYIPSNVTSSSSAHAHAQNSVALPFSRSDCEGHHKVLCRPLESNASRAEAIGPGRRRVASSCCSDHGFTSHSSIDHHDRRIRRSTSGTRRKTRRSMGWQICAEKSDRDPEPGNDEGPGEPGPSGNNNTEGSGGGEEDEELNVEARFRLQTTDWRAFRARLVKGSSLGDSAGTEDQQQQKRWAHPLAEPEKGCLLIAHPTAFGTRQTYFNQAVIFLFEHGQDGSAGFILNRPTSYALGQVPGFEKFEPEFVDSRLYMGGDVGTNLIQVLHGVPGLRESREVISGVYLGGPNAVKESVKGGDSLPDDYRWFLGYCGWRPGQLEREVALGVWYLASSSKDIVTDQCIRLKRPLWRQVLELMGGDYSVISRRAYGEL